MNDESNPPPPPRVHTVLDDMVSLGLAGMQKQQIVLSIFHFSKLRIDLTILT